MTLHTNVSARLWLQSGEPLRLGEPLSGATGEGTVYSVVERPGWAAKVFHPTLKELQVKLAKVAAMTQSPPPGALQPDGLVVLTWPQHIIAGEAGPVGYVMPRISTATTVELHTISNPSDRQNPVPTAPQWTRSATWRHLVNVAANLCLAVEVVHRVDAVISDFQERNILVSDTTRVTLVDCDSMQFIDGTGRQFLCVVGRPEFTAPELASVNLRTQPRGKSSDLFALAVHIHQLLMAGNHPFLRGDWTGLGQQPDALSLAKSGDWAGGPNSRLRTHPLAPPVTFLPIEIQSLFARAFTAGAKDPSARPSAGEWRAALARIALMRCPAGRHEIPVDCLLCPWCAIDEERALRTGRLPVGRLGAATGPQPLAQSPHARAAGGAPRTDPHTGAHPLTPNSQPDKIFGMSTRTYLTALAVVVLVVVALAAFIVWAVLSGSTTTFGSGDVNPLNAANDVWAGWVIAQRL
jgi:DNA-binding helix-hairpin-helix protein with protein kinase domain